MNIEAMLPAARSQLVKISVGAQLNQAAALFAEKRAGLIVVCDDSGRMVGVVSKTDILSRIGQCQGSACTKMVASVMTEDVVYCRPGDMLQKAWTMMKETGFPFIPVVDAEGRPVGTLYTRGVLQTLLREVEHDEDMLREYVMGVGYH